MSYSRKPLQRLTTTLVAAVAIAGQLAGTLHLALEEHAWCAEHGEAVDAEHGELAHAASAEHAAARLSQSVVASVQRADASHAEGGHEHCPLAADHRSRALALSGACTLPFILPTARVAVPSAAEPASSQRRLRLLAPKTSPPARA